MYSLPLALGTRAGLLLPAHQGSQPQGWVALRSGTSGPFLLQPARLTLWELPRQGQRIKDLNRTQHAGVIMPLKVEGLGRTGEAIGSSKVFVSSLNLKCPMFRPDRHVLCQNLGKFMESACRADLLTWTRLGGDISIPLVGYQVFQIFKQGSSLWIYLLQFLS